MKKIRGTRDIFPYLSYQNIYQFLRSLLLSHNFKEIHTPIFEPEEVFLKSLGEQTDVVNKEMYYVTHLHDQKEIEKIVLRPEMTASIMRAYFEEKIIDNPLKVFQIGEVFRHERPQKGRYREFFQCSIECLGTKSIAYDAQLIIFLYQMFSELLSQHFWLEINYIADTTIRENYKKHLYQYCLQNINICKEEYLLTLGEKNILRILDTKEKNIQECLLKAPKIENFLDETNQLEWEELLFLLDACNIKYKKNNHLVRGLDYYNGVVFEFKSSFLGAQSTFCGGGRYDGLSKNFFDKVNLPALGAGIGIDRLLIILEEIDSQIIKNKKIPKCSIVFDSIPTKEGCLQSLILEEKITQNNIITDIYFDKKSLKSALKKAHNEKVDFVFIIHNSEKITLKDMHIDKKQHDITFENLNSYLNYYSSILRT